MTSPELPHDRPLAGVRVFVPRSPDRARELLAALRDAGAVPVAAPLISISHPRDPAPLDGAVQHLAAGAYDWLAVTSSFAVDGLQRAARRRDQTLGQVVAAGRAHREGSTRVAAVADATAAALARAGVTVDFIPRTEQSARGMLADWPATAPGTTALLPQSDLAEPHLAAGLAARGWEVQAVVAYTNSAAAPLPAGLIADLATGRVEAVVLTSGSAARRLVAQTTLPASTVVCCIGPRTAEVAATLGLRVGVVAMRPTPAALVDALATALAAPLEPNHDPEVTA